jgi:hypothetical protein
MRRSFMTFGPLLDQDRNYPERTRTSAFGHGILVILPDPKHAAMRVRVRVRVRVRIFSVPQNPQFVNLLADQ